MNRSLIVVKSPYKSREFMAIRVHWDYGEKLVDWLERGYMTHNLAVELMWQGHRSSILQPHRLPDQCPEHWNFKTLTAAVKYCEHLTLAYHNGAVWKFTHNRRE